MLTASELETLSALIDKMEAELEKRRAPRTIYTRASDARLAIGWLASLKGVKRV